MLPGQGCARSQAMRSSAALCALDRWNCARVHVTTMKIHGVVGVVMAARATQTLRADEACARSHPLGLSAQAGARF